MWTSIILLYKSYNNELSYQEPYTLAENLDSYLGQAKKFSSFLSYKMHSWLLI